MVSSLGEDSIAAIEQFASLQSMEKPASLDPRDVLVAVKSASVG